MHVQHASGPRPVVEIIDILRDQQQVARPDLVEPGQRFMRGVRVDRSELLAALVIEFLDHVGITGKGLGRSHILNPVPFPQPVRTAKGRHGATGMRIDALMPDKSPGKPVWDVVADYLRDRKSARLEKVNQPKLKNVAGNPGLADYTG